jgi:hypothetical protein
MHREEQVMKPLSGYSSNQTNVAATHVDESSHSNSFEPRMHARLRIELS